MAGAVAHAEWDAEGFATALRLDDAEKAELLAAWETYRTGKDAEDLTPAAILRELLGEMNDRYVQAHGRTTCVLGQCNCGAALQLAPEQRQRGVKIVYSWSKAEAGVSPTDIGNPAHEYGKDFTIEAVFVDIAYLKQVISGNGPCEISARKGRIPKKFKDVTLVDMLAASAMQKMEANEATKWFRVGDGVGLLTAPPARIPRAWRHAETKDVPLFAGTMDNGALWPYSEERCRPCSAQACVMAAVDSVGSADTSPEEDMDLLADEAVMERAYKMRIVEAAGPYCTFQFTKTRENVSLLLSEVSEEDTALDRYGSLYEVKDHKEVNLKQSLARAQTASKVLHALEYIHRMLPDRSEEEKMSRKCYASRDSLRTLLPSESYISGTMISIDEVGDGISKFAAWWKSADGNNAPMDWARCVPAEMKTVVDRLHDAFTKGGYKDKSIVCLPHELYCEMVRLHKTLDSNKLTLVHLTYYVELLLSAITPDGLSISIDSMQDVCENYAIRQYTMYALDYTHTTVKSSRKISENSYEKIHKSIIASIETGKLQEDAIQDIIDPEIKSAEQKPPLHRAETLAGRYWVTLHDIEPATGVTAQAAAEAALCWAEWFRAYANRGGNAKQRCAGVLVRIAAPVPIMENGTAGACVRTLLGALQMGYTPCARPMLRHGGGADATHTWYANETRDAAFEGGEPPGRMDGDARGKEIERFSTWAGVPVVDTAGGAGSDEGKPGAAAAQKGLNDDGGTQKQVDEYKKIMVSPSASPHKSPTLVPV